MQKVWFDERMVVVSVLSQCSLAIFGRDGRGLLTSVSNNMYVEGVTETSDFFWLSIIYIVLETHKQSFV